MTAERKDGQTGADSANVDSPNIFYLQRCFPGRSAPDQLSALCREQNPAGPRSAYSLERTSGFVIRCACCSSSPDQGRASGNPATRGVPAAAALLSTLCGCIAAGLREIGPTPQQLG